MTYDELKAMTLAELLDMSMDPARPKAEQLQGAEAALARLPRWRATAYLSLEPAQREQLKWLTAEAA